MVLAWKYNLPFLLYAPTTIKKTFAGHGHADKEAVISKVMELYPDIELNSDDEADAIAVLHCYMMEPEKARPA